MVGGVAVYPAGWNEAVVQETCGPTADQYNIGMKVFTITSGGGVNLNWELMSDVLITQHQSCHKLNSTAQVKLTTI